MRWSCRHAQWCPRSSGTARCLDSALPLLGTAIAKQRSWSPCRYTGGGVNVSLQGPHWAQERRPALPRWWVEAGQYDRLIDIGGCQYLRKECHIRPQYNPRTIWVPSQASLTHRKGMEFPPHASPRPPRGGNAAFMDSHFRSAWARGSKGGRHTASNNRGKSHAGGSPGPWRTQSQHSLKK